MSYRNEAADRDVLRFVNNYHAEHGYAPTIRELTEHLGMNAVSGMHHRVRRLIEEGKLRNAPGVGRSLCITPHGMKLIGGTVEL